MGRSAQLVLPHITHTKSTKYYYRYIFMWTQEPHQKCGTTLTMYNVYIYTVYGITTMYTFMRIQEPHQQCGEAHGSGSAGRAVLPGVCDCGDGEMEYSFYEYRYRITNMHVINKLGAVRQTNMRRSLVWCILSHGRGPKQPSLKKKRSSNITSGMVSWGL